MKNYNRSFCYQFMAVAFLLSIATSARAALVSRLNGQAVYDTDLNITWLANANLAATQTFGVSGIQPGGYMSWPTALNWISAMNAANYLGHSDWRLPATLWPDPTCTTLPNYPPGGEFNCTGSEMGHLFYVELGGVARQSITTTHNANYSLFQNIIPDYYWSGTQYSANYAWNFRFNDGGQITSNEASYDYVWAVHPGDVVAVPVPAAFWLFGSGLMGQFGFIRRRK